MSIHKLEDGTCVIGSGGLWLPGCYEDERAARFAFRLPNEELARLRDQSVARGDGVITWGDIAKASEQRRGTIRTRPHP